MPFSRNRRSKLDRPDIVTFLRRCATSRLKGADKRHHSLQRVADRIAKRFGVKVHKSTVHRFLKDLGADLAWGKAK
ncbi:winged helix-turn-helix domain-containing protein [Paraburkholderia atlantica]|uniref:winged helix-turn-helix domain-containing protein n=1 Tax=Paraburkholderia TaxID=1822464 RepID=UPI003D1BF996